MTYRMDDDECIDYGLWQGSSPDSFHMHKITRRAEAEDSLLDGFAPSMMIGATGELNIGEDNEVIYPGYEYQYWAYLQDEEMVPFQSGPPNDGYESESEEGRLEVFPTNANVPRRSSWPTIPETTEEPVFAEDGKKMIDGIADYSNVSGVMSDRDLDYISQERYQPSSQRRVLRRQVQRMRGMEPNPQAAYTGRI